MKELSDLIPLLHPSKIFCSKIVNVDLKENRVVGLSVYCPPMELDELVEKVRGIVGDGFVVQKFPNDAKIEIEKK